MKTEYCKRRDKQLSAVIELAYCVYIPISISYIFLVEPIFEIESGYTEIFFLTLGITLIWGTICEKNIYCREGTFFFLSTVFFFCECLLKAPFWLLVKGIYGAYEIYMARLGRFLRLEMRRFKKHL